MNTCKLCKTSYKNRASLNKHVSRTHKLSPKDYTIKFDLNDVRPTCECECGQEVNWSKGRPKRFVKGHQVKDKDIRKIMIDKGRAASQDPQKRLKNSNAIKKLWNENVKWRKAALEKLVIARTMSPVGTKEYYLTSTFRSQMSKSKSEFWASAKGDVLRETMKGDEFRQNVSVATKQALSNPETRKLLSENACNLIENGIIGPNKTKRSSIINEITGFVEYFHSTWEHIFYDFMSVVKLPVTKNHKIRIKYFTTDGVEHSYIPDFIENNQQTLYEVKGRLTDVDELKFIAAKKFCDENKMMFVVITKDDINEIINFMSSTIVKQTTSIIDIT
jgi:cytochrome c2